VPVLAEPVNARVDRFQFLYQLATPVQPGLPVFPCCADPVEGVVSFLHHGLCYYVAAPGL